MKVTIKHQGDVRFEAFAGNHRVICDQPRNNGGSDDGMSPSEFLLVSLGTCAGYYAAQYLKTRSLSTQGLEIKVVAGKAYQPARIGQIRIDIDIPGLDARHKEGVLRAIKTCLVHNTLLHPPEISTMVNASLDAELPALRI